MTENLAIKALSTKKRGKLTPLEVQQVSDLQKVYGRNNVISAIRFAKSAHIGAVANMLLQHCGVRPFVPPSVRDIIPDKASAEKLLSPEKFQVACRLGDATRQTEAAIEESTKTLLAMWKSKVERLKVGADVETTIRVAIRRFGPALAKHAVEVIPTDSKLSGEQLTNLYKVWLENASIKNWALLESILVELGNTNETANWGIPDPMPIRLQKYFRAKANREMKKEEASRLWELLQEHKIEKMIHSMSCIPASEFSIHKLERLLTPQDLWEYYELDVEERIDTLIRRRLGRAGTNDEINCIVHFLEETQTSFEDLYDAVCKLAPKEMFSLPLIKMHLAEILEVREDERLESTIESEYAAAGSTSSASSDHDNGYDYSTIDENSLQGDDFLDDYDMEEFDLIESPDE
jgi:hypothetical protein